MNFRATAQHGQRVEDAVRSHAAATSALIASWKRSMTLHRLDPGQARPPERLTEQELSIARERVGPLLATAQPSLDRLYQAVGDVGCCVLLADRDGVPVDRRGASADDKTFSAWGLWTGAVWSEGSEGTNAIGTCVVDGRPLTIHRDQHFFSRNTLMSCTAAPVYDHEGRLAAVLDVSSCRADLTENFLNLIAAAVLDAARRIEAENFRQRFPDARIVLAPGAEKSPSALLAVDADDLIVGATRCARQALGLGHGALPGALPAADILGGADRDSEGLDHAERAALKRALARAGDNVSAAAASLGISRATLHRKLKRYELR